MEDYESKRGELLKAMLAKKYSAISWSADEDKADIAFQEKLIKPALKALPADYYFTYVLNYKDLIESSFLFQFLVKETPKGAILHLHLASEIDPDWLVKKTYDPNVYEQAWDYAGRTFVSLYYTTNPKPKDVNMVKAREEERKKLGEIGVKEFDSKIRKKLSLQLEDINMCKTNEEVWKHMMQKYFYGWTLIHYVEFMKEHLELLCKKYVAEGIGRVEVRHTPGKLRKADESRFDINEEMKLYQYVVAEIKKTAPNFSLGIIYVKANFFFFLRAS